MMNAITVLNISKTLMSSKTKITALDNISFNIKKGEIFSLLGPNGAGKTTLINCMLNIVIPDSGVIKILGHDVLKNSQVLDKMNLVSAYTRFFLVTNSN